MPGLPDIDLEFLRAALAEDVAGGDVTSSATIPQGHRSEATLTAKEDFTLAGLPYAEATFILTDPDIEFNSVSNDGQSLSKGDIIATLSGLTAPMLMAERVALNILQRLSGIATLTASYVSQVQGLNVKILDTRKTTPLMRKMEKYAVTCGGGHNHRMGLYDAILIKDNHIEAAGGIGNAIRAAKSAHPELKCEAEAETLAMVSEALEAGADIIMLDNMSLDDMRIAVEQVKGRALLEASGNMSIDTLRSVAETGVDYISVGALTHSAPSADISMRIKAL